MIKVVYFSRTGNSKRVAEKIAQKIGSHVSVLTDDKNWKGLLGYI
ncbi:MAG: flavodoxin family protein, partial [Vallitaleaceae bacterium]|nr:flavodoxin family protein [Vallitaleaceae bacterium]